MLCTAELSARHFTEVLLEGSFPLSLPRGRQAWARWDPGLPGSPVPCGPALRGAGLSLKV